MLVQCANLSMSDENHARIANSDVSLQNIPKGCFITNRGKSYQCVRCHNNAHSYEEKQIGGVPDTEESVDGIISTVYTPSLLMDNRTSGHKVENLERVNA